MFTEANNQSGSHNSSDLGWDVESCLATLKKYSYAELVAAYNDGDIDNRKKFNLASMLRGITVSFKFAVSASLCFKIFCEEDEISEARCKDTTRDKFLLAQCLFCTTAFLFNLAIYYSSKRPISSSHQPLLNYYHRWFIHAIPWMDTLVEFIESFGLSFVFLEAWPLYISEHHKGIQNNLPYFLLAIFSGIYGADHEAHKFKVWESDNFIVVEYSNQLNSLKESFRCFLENKYLSYLSKFVLRPIFIALPFAGALYELLEHGEEHTLSAVFVPTALAALTACLYCASECYQEIKDITKLPIINALFELLLCLGVLANNTKLVDESDEWHELLMVIYIVPISMASIFIRFLDELLKPTYEKGIKNFPMGDRPTSIRACCLCIAACFGCIAHLMGGLLCFIAAGGAVVAITKYRSPAQVYLDSHGCTDAQGHLGGCFPGAQSGPCDSVKYIHGNISLINEECVEKCYNSCWIYLALEFSSIAAFFLLLGVGFCVLFRPSDMFSSWLHENQNDAEVNHDEYSNQEMIGMNAHHSTVFGYDNTVPETTEDDNLIDHDYTRSGRNVSRKHPNIYVCAK